MPYRLTDEDRVVLMANILRKKREDGLALKNACIRYGLRPTSFPEFKKTVLRILQRNPQYINLIHEKDREYLNGSK